MNRTSIGLGVVSAALATIAQPAAARDWLRSDLAKNWMMFEQTFQVGGKSQTFVVGYPGGSEGNVTAAVIPVDGDITFYNFLFLCEERTGKALNKWQSDRNGGVTRDDGADADYEPVPAGSMAEEVFNFACRGSTDRWTPIEGDVLTAASRRLGAN